jgi:ectoine hydroxylase-related dioxygenase (phytanoyl-CoA dioxygenase family)
MFKPFSEEQLSAWDRDGFLVLRADDLWTDPSDVEKLVHWTNELVSWKETPGKWMMYFGESLKDKSRILHRIENFFDYHEGFNTLFNSASFLGLLSQLLKEPAVLYKEKINFKLPGGEGFDPHQDHAAGWWQYGHKLHISVLITIDAATPENGCLEVVAGKHKEGLLGPEYKGVPQELVDQFTWIPCETKPGDIVFFDSFVPHRSAANLSEKSRRALYVTYNRAGEGDFRAQYYADKRKSYPPDVEREEGKVYTYKI